MACASRRAATALAGAAIAAGCATGEPAREGLREARDAPMAPYESTEACVALAEGDRLDWSFQADAPVRFDIRYRESGATLMPIVREEVDSDAGIFRALLERDYCAAWEAGARGARLTYRLRRVEAPR